MDSLLSRKVKIIDLLCAVKNNRAFRLRLKNLACFFFAVLRGLWDLSSLNRDRTFPPLQWERGVLTTGPPGKSLLALVLDVIITVRFDA